VKRLQLTQELVERAEGKAKQSVEIQTASSGDAFDLKSREELEAYATSGALPEWFPNEKVQ